MHIEIVIPTWAAVILCGLGLVRLGIAASSWWDKREGRRNALMVKEITRYQQARQ